MTVAQARWRAARISSNGSRSSLIAKYAASSRASAPIPLPTMVSIYHFRRRPDAADTGGELSPVARQACLKIRTALSDNQRCIVVTGSATPALSVVVETAISGLGYQKIYSAEASHVEQLLDALAKRSAREVPSVPVPPFILIIENVDSQPSSLVEALTELPDNPQHALVQMVLVGQSKAQDGSGREQYCALADRDHVRVELKQELATKRGSDLEKDLVRAWQNAGAEKRAYAASEAVSPYPALAALLGQPMPPRSKSRKWVIITVVILLLCCIGSLSILLHSNGLVSGNAFSAEFGRMESAWRMAYDQQTSLFKR